jgi:hypothetical protein
LVFRPFIADGPVRVAGATPLSVVPFAALELVAAPVAGVPLIVALVPFIEDVCGVVVAVMPAAVPAAVPAASAMLAPPSRRPVVVTAAIMSFFM